MENRNGNLLDLQVTYCPSFDARMPDDDREFILNAMGVVIRVEPVAHRGDNNEDMFKPGSTHFSLVIERNGEQLSTYFTLGPGIAHVCARQDPFVMFDSILQDTVLIDDGIDLEALAKGLCLDLEDEKDKERAERVWTLFESAYEQLHAMFTDDELSELRELLGAD